MLDTNLLVAPGPESNKDARSIFVVPGTTFGLGSAPGVSGLADLNVPPGLADLADRNGFRGDIGQVLASDEGVLLGCGDGQDPFSIAAIPEKLPAGVYTLVDAPTSPQAAYLSALGWLLGCYRFDRYREHTASGATLVVPAVTDLDRVKREAAAIALVRDLVNTPAGDMQPEALSSAACKVAEDHRGNVGCLVGDALIAQNFPMIHAVGRAASQPPRLVDLRWHPHNGLPPDELPQVVLVGKGVVFDSGGLNIKGAGGMALMKKDMGGAANAIGLAQMIMQANLPVRLRVLLPIVENAISASAFRPGDVLPSRKGLSVEIGNTDAEGRLILADALTFAAEESPDLIISLATLTGAARVALGPEIVPFYATDDAVAESLHQAGDALFDPIWRLPIWSRYGSMLSSTIADTNNISGNSFAGSIIAALFLRRFLPAEQNWLHFDLYAWRPQSEPGRPKGGDAQCIRALMSMLDARYGTPSAQGK